VIRAQETGAEMYAAWCAVCHGEDGRGRPAAPRVKTVPMDFTDCRQTTPETDADWTLVTTHGGTAVGRSSEMPGFEMLPAPVIARVLAYVRGFCRESGWPEGELNFPRSLVAAKAFPEQEVVFEAAVSHGADSYPRAAVAAAYAIRIGRRAHLGVELPAEAVSFAGRRHHGIGDVALEGQYVVHASGARGTIVSVGLEASMGTGSRRWGFGEGTAVFTPYVAAGVTRGAWYLQGDVRGFLPLRLFPTEPVHRVAYAASLLRTLGTSPRAWTAGVAVSGIGSSVALSPEILKGLTRTRSLSAGAAADITVRPVFPAIRGTTRWRTYLLWDYAEPLRARP
jgi:hypothetical protein